MCVQHIPLAAGKLFSPSLRRTDPSIRPIGVGLCGKTHSWPVVPLTDPTPSASYGRARNRTGYASTHRRRVMFDKKCRGVALGALLATAMWLPAHATTGAGRFDAGYTSLLRHDHEQAITRFTDAIQSGELRPNVLALAYHYRGAELLTTGRDD